MVSSLQFVGQGRAQTIPHSKHRDVRSEANEYGGRDVDDIKSSKPHAEGADHMGFNENKGESWIGGARKTIHMCIGIAETDEKEGIERQIEWNRCRSLNALAATAIHLLNAVQKQGTIGPGM